MTLLPQTPIPPVPPVLPHTTMALGGHLGDAAAVIITLAVLCTVGMLVWPLVRALARRLESGGRNAQLQGELDALRDRLQQLEQSQARVAELEERLDFTERLLAQSREPDRLER
jgi:Tfp pilus assembly protein PilN